MVRLHMGKAKVNMIEVQGYPSGDIEEANATRIQQELEAGLNELAHLCRTRQMQIRLVAVKGAINTLLLRSRANIPRLSIMDELPNDQKPLLSQMIAQVAKQHQRLSRDWLNNRATLLIEPEVRQPLVSAAIAQGAIIFNQPGLRVYAAPWRYLFVSTVERLSQEGAAAHQDPEAADAAIYLRYIMQEEGRNSVSLDDIHRWRQRYFRREPGTMEVACGAVNKAYSNKFGKRPINA